MESNHAEARSRLILLGLIAAVVWGGMILKFTSDWSTNAQYEFGYFVPFFIAFLLFRRCSSRPQPEHDISRWVILAVGLFTLMLLLPIRTVQEANPDWRPFNWFYASVVLALSLVPFALIGGCRWVRHFSFPFILIFLAIPWPLAIEQGVLQTLTVTVTAVTVELLNLFNIPALQRGNVIDLAAGSVGVADACSGIRSLAGTLMASVFFGEFYRVNAVRRLLLVVCGVVIAFGLNLCRTFFLSWRASLDGIASIEKWHDPAGFTIFLISFAALWAFALFLARKQQPIFETSPGFNAHIAISTKVLMGVCVWVLAIEVGKEGWYRLREGARSKPIAWNMRWPQEGATFRFTPIPDEARSILRYTVGNSASFGWPDGAVWQMFFFRWEPGRSSVQLATMHRPDICLPAAGYRYVGVAEPFDIEIGDIKFPFTGSIFDLADSQRSSTNIYVYRCLWEDHQVEGVARNRNFDMSIAGRITSAWYGRRNLGQRLIQVGVAGVRSEVEAQNTLRRHLPELIEVDGKRADPFVSGAAGIPHIDTVPTLAEAPAPPVPPLFPSKFQ